MTSNQIDNAHGFNVGTMPNGEKILTIESARLDDCVKYLVENGIKHIQVFYTTGYTRKDLDFLVEIGELIEGLSADDSVDFSGLSRLKNLRDLVIYNERQTIDISIFPNLKCCAAQSGPELLGLDKCLNLERLLLTSYKPKTGDMTEFPALPKLVDLNFVRGTLCNLAGIERLSLNTLTLSYIPKLTSCKELLKLSAVLRRLQFDHCPNVGDFAALAEMEMLEKLMLRQTGSVPSLQFIKHMKSLVFFSFWGTNVIDGDLSPLTGLKYAGFDNKRHYSHRFEDFTWERIGWD